MKENYNTLFLNNGLIETVKDCTNLSDEEVKKVLEMKETSLLGWTNKGVSVFNVLESVTDSGLEFYHDIAVKYVPTLEEKIHCKDTWWYHLYANYVNYNSYKYDPDGEKLKAMCKYIARNKELFFNKDENIKLKAPNGYTRKQIRFELKKAMDSVIEVHAKRYRLEQLDSYLYNHVKDFDLSMYNFNGRDEKGYFWTSYHDFKWWMDLAIAYDVLEHKNIDITLMSIEEVLKTYNDLYDF